MMLWLSVGALALLPLAHAEDGCETEEDAIELETPAGTFYLWSDACQPECFFSVWVYQESNGKDGLQRGGEYPGGCEGADQAVF